MRLNVKALALSGAVFWGGMLLLTGLANLVAPPYGAALLDLMASLYPGYGGAAGFGSVALLTVYGLVDGAIGGFVIAWLYNFFSAREAAA